MKFCKIFFSLLAGCLILNLITPVQSQAQQAADAPLRLAVAGITHSHTSFILGRKGKNDINIVGIYEPNRELALRLAARYKFSPDIIYSDLNKMLDAVKPEAVAAFGSIYEHMAVVEAAAPRGIHVMVEKPLATNMEHALKMQQLANKYKIHLLTDYETAWYPSTAKAYQLVTDSNYVGDIRKVVVHDGHNGPARNGINVNPEFLAWLTDPIQNGGGALVDFGCYGANLMTYLMGDQKPVSVTAVTKNFKPETYTKVEDEATIIVTYPKAQCIIQASWNWPFDRKDMEIYGSKGYVITTDKSNMRLRNTQTKGEQAKVITDKDIAVYTEPFTYFVDVIRGKVQVPKNGMYSLENNMTVVKILSAARESAKTGKTVMIKN
ncbi:MAG TPA: oxidoreductase [Sphingobacteriaceae bacterium]|nr:oxidoreductase [Sphingobacteriaceae bacterium]